MIEVKNLVKDYGGHLAVDHLSFTVQDGQIYGFLGPNGAGKSTTMNIMAGYLGATEGEVLIDGHNILDEPEEAKKCMGYLPEMPPLYLDMTAREYLVFASKLKKIPKSTREKAIEEVMELVKIADVQGRLIKNLSKGYRQRVGMAQAILGKPDVIILDEPTVGLDPKQIIEIRDMIRDLGKKHTVILSSHILSEVSAVCDHIVIISHGKLIASDTPENLERRMEGSAGLELDIKGSTHMVRGLLASIPSVQVGSISQEAGNPMCHVSLQVAKNTADTSMDVREALFYAFADKRMPILTMTPSRASLEDVFLELTGDPAPGGGTEPEENTGQDPAMDSYDTENAATDSSATVNAATDSSATENADADSSATVNTDADSAKTEKEEETNESDL